jgi:pimeloyl-ACP methyl ester carboxylesterase
VIEAEALTRIGQYFGMDPTFATYDEFKTYVKTISAPFGPLTAEQWEHVARTNSRQRDNGRFGVNYDPAIAVPFRAQPSAGNLWPVWDQIRCPTLVLRGAESDLLSHETAQAMTTRGPHARLVEFAQVGHAPMLLARDQVDIVVDFLRSTV